MQIILKNKELAPTINFLQSINLKPKDSRHRSKLVKLLSQTHDELSKEEIKLMESYDLMLDGRLIEEKNRDPKQVALFKHDQNDLLNEEVIIEGGTYAKNIDEIPRILNEFEGEISGVEAEVYDRLLDEFEKNMVIKDAE